MSVLQLWCVGVLQSRSGLHRAWTFHGTRGIFDVGGLFCAPVVPCSWAMVGKE